jgi:hypothetical protein
MSVGFTSSGEPATEEELARAEQELGVAIPAAYRRFLQQANGAEMEPNEVDREKLDDPVGLSVRQLYGVGDHDGRALVRNRRRFQDLPETLLPIGEDVGGNGVAIGVAGDEEGRVYFKDHEVGLGEGEGTTWEGVTPLARDFDTLLDALKPEEAHEEAEDPDAEVWVRPGFLEELRRKGQLGQ